MIVTKHDIRRGAYYDSVVLMQLQRGLIGLPGVLDAGVVMATSANCELLAANNLLPESITASPDDLLIVVKADNDASAAGGRDASNDPIVCTPNCCAKKAMAPTPMTASNRERRSKTATKVPTNGTKA